jgi:hypothetical protein
MNKLLFLDFDGVLHPNFSREGEYFSRLDLLLESLVGNTSGLEIIVSSSWRFHFTFEEILGYLPNQLRDLVSGATPEVEPGRHQRYREIRAHLNEYGRIVSWRALDDDLRGFPKHCPQLIACDGRIGIDNRSVLYLRNWLMSD